MEYLDIFQWIQTVLEGLQATDTVSQLSNLNQRLQSIIMVLRSGSCEGLEGDETRKE